MKLLMFGLVDVPLSSNKLNTKGSINVLSGTLTCLDNLGIPDSLPKNYDLTTEVIPPYASRISLELYPICENCGGIE